jgi:hypothetical protein
MCVDGGVTRSAREVLVLFVGDVLVGFGVAVFLAETEVDQVGNVRLLRETHQVVFGLYVPVDVVLRVQPFDTLDLSETGGVRTGQLA